jgi:hypothetical protein
MDDDIRQAAIKWLSTRGYGRATVNNDMTDGEIAELLWLELNDAGVTTEK